MSTKLPTISLESRGWKKKCPFSVGIDQPLCFSQSRGSNLLIKVHQNEFQREYEGLGMSESICSPAGWRDLKEQRWGVLQVKILSNGNSRTFRTSSKSALKLQIRTSHVGFGKGQQVLDEHEKPDLFFQHDERRRRR